MMTTKLFKKPIKECLTNHKLIIKLFNKTFAEKFFHVVNLYCQKQQQTGLKSISFQNKIREKQKKHIYQELKKYFNEELFNFTKVYSLLSYSSQRKKTNPICLKEFDEFMSYCSADAIKELIDNFLTVSRQSVSGTPHDKTYNSIKKLFQRIFTGYQNNSIVFDQIQGEKSIRIDVLDQASESALGFQIKQDIESDSFAQFQNSSADCFPNQDLNTNNNNQ
ncbi:Hypothetical_protein [Hexamita inflata]|uniref:Hypothetical_protein n=1 Tax=Hexamita inflata TaxID=28002 RepID=A0AA86QUA8_9EUKA|nr:Hypothetical protein HINF_LOCUS50922 [Hexamita inflata]